MTDTVKIAVCDDEKNIRAYLVSLIKKQDIECSIMEYASADEYDGALFMQEESSLPYTTKQSTRPEIVMEHGIGLKNVHDMAERYYGGVKIKVKKDIFHVTVMLQQGEVKETENK